MPLQVKPQLLRVLAHHDDDRDFFSLGVTRTSRPPDSVAFCLLWRSGKVPPWPARCQE